MAVALARRAGLALACGVLALHVSPARSAALSSEVAATGDVGLPTDTAVIDPPVAISARGRSMRIEALNGRGEVLLPVIAKAIEPLMEVTFGERSARLVTLEVAEPGRVFAEEERSRVPSVRKRSLHVDSGDPDTATPRDHEHASG